MTVIFLDVDGVIISGKSCRVRFDNPDPTCVKNLNDLLTRTNAKIVMSSCWRIGREIRELQQLMDSWGIQGFVLAKTPWGPQGCQRGDEIRTFLQEWKNSGNEPIDNFVIVDDDADMGQYLPRLVHTRFASGLTPMDVEMAIKILEKHKSPASQPSSV